MLKLVLLHGPAVVASRKFLTAQKAKFGLEDIVVFEKNFKLDELLASVTTLSLLSTNRLILVENPPEDLVIDPLPTQEEVTLVFWLDRELSSTKPLYKFAKKHNAEIILFPEAKEISVFPFLDLLGNKDQKAFMELKKLKSAGFDSQYIITMIIYFLRSLCMLSKNAPKFIVEKQARQLKNFSPERIKQLYRLVLETDFAIKSGLMQKEQAEFNIVQAFLS